MEKSTTTIPMPIRRRIFTRIGTTFKKRNTYVEIICSLYIILFIYTGINKILDYEKFKFEMGRSPFIENMAGLIAVALPAGELIMATMSIIPRTRLLGLYLSTFTMAMFTGYIWLMLTYASDLPCSCGGVLAAMSWNDHLYFNAAFTLLGIAGIIISNNKNVLNPIPKS
ncbi:MAG: hypothetical protein P0Y53_01345 [Candidatus Pseudobacter hemicellulosilyticus]|uniref:Methylamine utilisation protein MauE domain-containing protein n=1 Tax=Candidatus Pseudobacter hemicellulosilyticus TaxID=3121375 RepID=A0AAJ5WT06_9BACT|nr:MAG: hypothetical protein P0Y53_01345 [Pseudobacter sp.]